MNFNSKPVRYGLTLVAFLLFIGLVKGAAGVRDKATASPIMAAEETEALMKESRAIGQKEGIEQAATGDASAMEMQLASALTRAEELTKADMEQLACARGNAYLSSSAKLANEKQINQQAWLHGQLRLENESVKALMTKYGSMNGEAAMVGQVQGHLLNRAAILHALSNLGSPVQCRIAPYDSAQAVDSLIYKTNQQTYQEAKK